jgi:signal transduction histidine kinase
MTTASHLKRSAGAALPAALRRALSAAEDRVAERHARPIGMGLDELTSDLRRISDAVRTLVQEGKFPVAVPGSRGVPRAVLDAYRVELVSELSERPPGRASGKDVIAVFSALEEIAFREGGEANPTFGGELARSEVLQGMREIAHDMRSPLAAILLLVEPIRKGLKGPVTPVQERQLGLIYGAALSLSALTDDILDAGQQTRPYSPVRRPFSISGVFEGACAVVRPVAEEKRLDLMATPPRQDGRVGDAAAIQRVVLNLVTNSLKYTEEGWVGVGCTELDGSRVEFWVEDTGVGIPDHALKVLVDGFRAGPAGFRFSSSGLGLAICRSLLEPMGGALVIEPRSGGGTRSSFVLDLPLAPSEVK